MTQAAPSARSRAPTAIDDADRPTSWKLEIEALLRRVDGLLNPRLDATPRAVRDSEVLHEAVRAQCQLRGKRVRAALCLLACELLGGIGDEAIDYALAIEHLQNFALIHDDIADATSVRRAEPSMWERFGAAQALTIGDAFFPLALAAVLGSDYSDGLKLRLLENTTHFALQMVEGQSLDIDLRRTPSRWTLALYRRCALLKTGAFFAMAALGGALIAGADAQQLASLSRFAVHAGLAYQIRDDVLDHFGDQATSDGPGCFTYHAAYALAAAVDEREPLLALLRKDASAITTGELRWLSDLFRRSGACEHAEREAANAMSVALEALEELPAVGARERLVQLCRYSTLRQR